MKILSTIIIIISCGLILYLIWAHDFNIFQEIKKWAFDRRYLLALLVLINIVVWRAWPHQESLKSLALFFLSPKTFVNQSIDSAIQNENKSNPEFKKRIDSDLGYKNSRIEEFRKQFSNSTNELKNSIWQAFATTFLVLICAFLFAFLCANIDNPWLTIIEIVSVFFVLWALMGQVGWSIQTFDGNTLPERINRYWYICLNLAGSFALFFLYFLKYFFKK